MIHQRDLRARAAEWALREDVVEKNYVLGSVLAGIGTEPKLRDGWVFKGGTCLKKCYLETVVPMPSPWLRRAPARRTEATRRSTV